MKKFLLCSLMLGSLFTMNGQEVIFEEDWDGTGPGIGGWTLYDEDGYTPANDPLSQLVNDAWNVLTLAEIQDALNPAYEYPAAATGMANNIVASNSYYAPVNTANDWLVTPAIIIPGGATGVELSWAATSLGNDTYLEDYEVNISTTDNQIASFDQLLDVPNELNDGNFRTVSLDDYIGQTIYIAFRNKGNDQYVMFLDNVQVTAATMGVNDVTTSNLSVYPNPANNIINVSGANNILLEGVQIVDMNGRTVKTVSLGGVTEAQINIADLSAGMYVMNLSSDQGMVTKKIVKK